MDRTTESIVDPAASLEYKDLPKEAVLVAKQRLIDSIGCALNAHDSEPCKIARKLAVPVTGAQYGRIIGSPISTTYDLAAFANGMAIRYLDYNDSYSGTGRSAGHPSDVIGAIITMADSKHVDGTTLITSIVAAYETMGIFYDQVDNLTIGWDYPVWDVLGSAIGVSKILKLNKEQMANALSIAAVANVALLQTRMGEISMWKAGAAGNAVRQGLFAAILASEGLIGPENAFDGPAGVWSQFKDVPRLKAAPFGAGGEFRVSHSTMKRWPVVGSAQSVVAAALELRKRIDVNHVDKLILKIPQRSYGDHHEKQNYEPKTRETADHSFAFCLAVSLIDGTITPETFGNKRYLDKDVVGLCHKVTIESPQSVAQQGHPTFLIEAIMRDGRSEIADLDIAKQKPSDCIWSDKEITEKFTELTRNQLERSQISRFLEVVMKLEKLDDVSVILESVAKVLPAQISR